MAGIHARVARRSPVVTLRHLQTGEPAIHDAFRHPPEQLPYVGIDGSLLPLLVVAT
jgi:hypothetical protein